MQMLNDEAVSSGIIPAQALNEISIAMLGRSASTIKYEGYDADIIVSGPYDNIGELKDIPIKTALGEYVNAGNITTLEKNQYAFPPFRVLTANIAMALTADFDLDYNKKDVLRDVRDAVDELEMQNVKITYEGEDELIKENFGSGRYSWNSRAGSSIHNT